MHHPHPPPSSCNTVLTPSSSLPSSSVQIPIRLTLAQDEISSPGDVKPVYVSVWHAALCVLPWQPRLTSRLPLLTAVAGAALCLPASPGAAVPQLLPGETILLTHTANAHGFLQLELIPCLLYCCCPARSTCCCRCLDRIRTSQCHGLSTRAWHSTGEGRGGRGDVGHAAHRPRTQHTRSCSS
jgi:hypothetical protein